jgi:hypothetical protein
LRDRVESAEQDLSDLDYWRKLADEMPNTIESMEDHGVKLVHQDEENAALDLEEQYFAYPVGGGKENIDEYLILIAKYETADVLYDHEAAELTLDDEGRVNGVVVREPDGQRRIITAGTVVLACSGFEGNPEMLTQYTGKDANDLPIIVSGIKYNRGAGIRMAMDIGPARPDSWTWSTPSSSTRERRRPLGHLGAELRDRGQRELRTLPRRGRGLPLRHHQVDRLRHLASPESEVVLHHKTVMERFEGSWVYETAALPPEQSDTIGGLAENLGLDPTKLEATVNEFNAACGPGDWGPVEMDGRTTLGITPPKSNWANPIVEAPFSGFPMTAQLKFTFGGLKVDTEGVR